ncbi:MAG: phenylalanine--tRNA ligase subunit beta [Candidatus Nealsonbacteria bacterium CG23_combo_of_CG06-09_8_20_14_all_36_12]|uniref:Phenylalanine--tRNA ligase beta subunit n=1 Tax=Candidatus Nealsonbacteria bacterium CG23_combo_of_CG06-09_8_20_14_all_36_12 TaxID=1974718 RepID=A0A2G9Z0F7_9BACT|nr:MAG: phenylalanine--tRNA ligase subunit beta [Candidatus Nealsonbacteria bacterium CG23_combo_of_CG06-09_8_20_14_all_36_12]
MKFSYNWLKELTKTKFSPQKLAELLTLHSFEINEVKKVDKDYLVDIDVLPNRMPDCASHIGIARETTAITKSKIKNQKSKIIEDKKLKSKDLISVEVKDKDLCPRYCARVIMNIKVSPSPEWLKKRLKICGIQSINNIVDATNYVMLEMGQPLHAFDFDKLSKNKKTIIVRRTKKRERITTLDNKKYDLEENILVIADNKEPLAIAGIKGGKKAEIDSKTKNIILESANFDRLNIYRTSKRINLQTDASLRFGAGLDPNLASQAIDRVAALIQKIAGGKITRGIVDVYPQKPSTKFWWGTKRIKLDLDCVERLLGIKIPVKEIKNILKGLNFKLSKVEPWKVEVEVPIFRLDISIPEDLIEEIGRIYGYQKIPARFPIASLVPPKRNENIFWEDLIKNILKEAGFIEVYNYSFINEKQAEIFGKGNLIEVENPVSVEQKYLRPSLIPNLLKNVKKNLPYFKEIKIFELGKIFSKGQEKRMLTGVMTGDAFYQIKGIVDLLSNKLGISNIWYDDYKPTPEESAFYVWQPKICAEIKIDNQEFGFLGEIREKVLENFEIPGKIVIFDIDFEKLQKLATEEQEYRPISRHPAAVRDISILVPQEIRVEEILNKIYDAGGFLIRDVDLFDIYEEIKEGKKSLAFHLIFQAEDRTLSSQELNNLMEKIIKNLEKEPDWQVRR